MSANYCAQTQKTRKNRCAWQKRRSTSPFTVFSKAAAPLNETPSKITVIARTARGLAGATVAVTESTEGGRRLAVAAVEGVAALFPLGPGHGVAMGAVVPVLVGRIRRLLLRIMSGSGRTGVRAEAVGVEGIGGFLFLFMHMALFFLFLYLGSTVVVVLFIFVVVCLPALLYEA